MADNCTICHIVHGLSSPAARTLETGEDDVVVWVCTSCDIGGLNTAKKIGALFNKLFGHDPEFDEFIRRWESQIDPTTGHVDPFKTDYPPIL